MASIFVAKLVNIIEMCPKEIENHILIDENSINRRLPIDFLLVATKNRDNNKKKSKIVKAEKSDCNGKQYRFMTIIKLNEIERENKRTYQ
jgi:hypothetical protein